MGLVIEQAAALLWEKKKKKRKPGCLEVEAVAAALLDWIWRKHS